MKKGLKCQLILTSVFHILCLCTLCHCNEHPIGEAFKFQTRIRFYISTEHAVDPAIFSGKPGTLDEFQKWAIALENENTSSTDYFHSNVKVIRIEPNSAWSIGIWIQSRFWGGLSDHDLDPRTYAMLVFPPDFDHRIIYPWPVYALLDYDWDIICHEERDELVTNNHETWPGLQRGENFTTMCPGERLHAERFVVRSCLKTGWSAKDMSRCNPNVDVANRLDLIKQQLDKDGQNNMTERVLHDIISMTLEPVINLPLTSSMAINILSIIDHLLLSGKSFLDEINSKTLRQATESVARNFPLEDKRSFSFRSKEIAMLIQTTRELMPKKGGYIHVNLNQTDNKTSLVFSNQRANSSSHGSIRIPINSILDKRDDSPRHISVYVVRDAALFDHKSHHSNVYSIVLPGIKDKILIEENVTMMFPRNGKDKTIQHACVYWHKDKDLNLGGWWSSSGCHLIEDEANSVCSCNHLSSFALMNLKGFSDEERKTLDTISLVGSSVSSLALVLTLMSYGCFKQLRYDIPSKILIGICSCLLMANLLLITDVVFVHFKHDKNKINDEEFPTLTCKLIAILLQFFLLSSLVWMGANGYYMYKAMNEVFGDFKLLLIKLAIFSVTLPLVIVLATVAVDVDGYYGVVQDSICWVKSDALTFSFLIPTAFILMFNFNSFLVVLDQVRRLSRSDPLYSTILRQLKGAVSLTCVLGLTWSFGFFAIGWGKRVFVYPFVILNSFLGLFIFLFYCVFKKEARRQWSRWWVDRKTLANIPTKSQSVTQSKTRKATSSQGFAMDGRNVSAVNNTKATPRESQTRESERSSTRHSTQV